MIQTQSFVVIINTTKEKSVETHLMVPIVPNVWKGEREIVTAPGVCVMCASCALQEVDPDLYDDNVQNRVNAFIEACHESQLTCHHTIYDRRKNASNPILGVGTISVTHIECAVH